jgi:hypothetical protein
LNRMRQETHTTVTNSPSLSPPLYFRLLCVPRMNIPSEPQHPASPRDQQARTNHNHAPHNPGPRAGVPPILSPRVQCESYVQEVSSKENTHVRHENFLLQPREGAQMFPRRAEHEPVEQANEETDMRILDKRHFRCERQRLCRYHVVGPISLLIVRLDRRLMDLTLESRNLNVILTPFGSARAVTRVRTPRKAS